MKSVTNLRSSMGQRLFEQIGTKFSHKMRHPRACRLVEPRGNRRRNDFPLRRVRDYGPYGLFSRSAITTAQFNARIDALRIEAKATQTA